VIEYENRIKFYSTPDKIFRYFATLKVNLSTGDEIYMTPGDFVRSIIPDVKQPEGLGLDQFKKFDPAVDHLNEALPSDSIFAKLGEHGLISFADYVFLLTVLSTPPKSFEVAFKMFDINGDGEVDHFEFEQVASVIRASGPVGQRHRDHPNTGSVIQHNVSSALAHYFFGPNLDRKLTTPQFLKFQKDIHRGVLQLEFNRFSPDEQTLTEMQFAKLLLMYVNHSSGKKTRMMKRIKKRYVSDDDDESDDAPAPVLIKYEEVVAFWDLLSRLNEVEQAISFWTLSGSSIDKDTFKHVAKVVAKTDLSDHLIEVVFELFDDDEDEMLSYREFFSVMKARTNRNLVKPRDTGVARLASACFTCTRKTDFIYGLKQKVGLVPPDAV
jgi:Ca2+-binding EF-hand superfamily protein